MPKLKLPRKSTNIDMTAMCDVAFLLLTFFMLATKFKPDEPVVVKTPSSISEIPLPDNDIMMITVDPKGRVFFSIDNKNMRKSLIENIDEYKKLGLTDQEKNMFAIGSSIGLPFNQLKSFLAAPPDQQKQFEQSAPGVPTDTTVNSDANELAAWIRSARNTNPKLRIVIKADESATYPEVKKVIHTLEGWKIFKFNLLTNLKAVPPGTAAYELQQGGKKES
ncbi:ExbD/TolR family protein [Taibaiella soli]|uniref:Biopolymer transporter ExbD n=1 Tax=Taibaiella soli TaxID=1649169 RepID=A0A2W2BC10_9BACT|nr:biopolymer transporter ExbD [Taibaiella soli]PZF73427.1 biopolymer transporter ExbD [Taibaiella soli]